jgi:magnesium-transporting ATPase (P-type)
MVGVVSFVNNLKEETAGTISQLKDECGIKVQMITGDNIYTAVQTAIRASIIDLGQRIAICQKSSTSHHTPFKVTIIEAVD